MGNFGSKNTKTSGKKCSLPEPIYPLDSKNSLSTRNGGGLNGQRISISARTTPRSAKNSSSTDFHKSLSMYELRRRKSRAARGSIEGENSLPENGNEHNDASPTTYQANRGQKQSARRLGSNGEEKSNSISSSNRLPMPLSRTQSMRKDPHPIILAHREIIAYCFENSHSDLGHRICMRLYEKRPDFQKFVMAYGRDKWTSLTTRLKDYLEDVVLNLDNLDMVEKLSIKYGEEHVELKTYGFKPDFWVSLADAITVECVILDQANHSPTDTVAAWSQLVSIMFTSIRDGYYNALRALRIISRKSLRRQATIDSTNAKEPEITNTTNENNRPAPLVLNNNRVGVTYSMPCISPLNGGFNEFQKGNSPIRLETPIFE